MKFKRLYMESLNSEDHAWLKPVEPFCKADFPVMLRLIRERRWSLWRLPEPAKGIAVTYPDEGMLFIYYLHGRGLFGSLTSKDLLNAASELGLNGVRAEVESFGRHKLLKSLGFKVVEHTSDPPHWVMELKHG